MAEVTRLPDEGHNEYIVWAVEAGNNEVEVQRPQIMSARTVSEAIMDYHGAFAVDETHFRCIEIDYASDVYEIKTFTSVERVT